VTENGVLTLSRLRIQSFYNNLQIDVKRVLCSLPVNNSSTNSLKRQEWYNLIVSALGAIKDSKIEATEDEATENNAMEEDRIRTRSHGKRSHGKRSHGTQSHVTGDGAMNNATVTVDEVLDKLLDNAIGTYGFSARDVYIAILQPSYARNRIDEALAGLTYHSLREIVAKVGLDPDRATVPHRIFSVDSRRGIGNAHFDGPYYTADFKSRWIRTLVLGQLNFLQDLDATYMITEMAAMSFSAAFAGFIYESFATRKLASDVLKDLGLTNMVAVEGTTFRVPDNYQTIKSPFDRPRQISRITSTDSLADIPGKHLSDYFWVPMSPNNPLFDAYVIEFDDSAPSVDAVVWILQMTLSKDHGGSSDGYPIIRSIKEKVREAMGSGRRKNVKVNYVLVSPEAGRWKLPQDNRRLCSGDVYHLRISQHDTINQQGVQ
jgi:hypothetical protein